jgi:hypothetical protein
MLALGALLRQHAGEHEFDVASTVGIFVAGPVAVVYPAFTIVTGILAILLGVAGVVVGVVLWQRGAALAAFAAACGANLAWQLAVMVMLSLGKIGASGPGALVISLVVAFNMMPAYFALITRSLGSGVEFA